MNSKEHWLSVRRGLDKFDVPLGGATAQAYANDPRMLAFITARYKFVSKMLEGVEVAMEVGCGDAFGAPIVAQSVNLLVCTDIDEEVLEQNRQRCIHPNIEFRYVDFRKDQRPGVQAIFLVDVIEHIYPQEEQKFINNLAWSIDNYNGFILIGTPNKTAEAYASEHSRAGHVNLKTHDELRELLKPHFRNVFMFSMNDEVVHTGYAPMAHYIWALGVTPNREWEYV